MYQNLRMFLFRLVKAHTFIILSSEFFLLVASGIPFYQTFVINHAVDGVISNSVTLTNFVMLMIPMLLLLIVDFTATRILVPFVRNICLLETKKRLFDSLLFGRYGFVARIEPGDFLNRHDANVDSLSRFVEKILLVLPSIVVIGSLVIYLIIYVHPLALILFVVALPLSKAIEMVAKRLSRKQKDLFEASGLVSRYLMEIIPNLTSIKSYGAESKIESEFKNRLTEQLQLKKKSSIIQLEIELIKFIYEAFSIIGIPIIAFLLALQGLTTAGGAVATIWVAISIRDHSDRLISIFSASATATAAVDRIREYSKAAIYTKRGTIDESCQELLRLRDVCFSYTDNTPVLRNVSFSINRHESLLIVGRTGSGKTTLLKLLTGEYKPDSGFIDLFCSNSNEMEKYHSHLGVVNQDPYLFEGTVFENLLYADESKGKDEFYFVACQIGLRKAINSLPNGIDTNVGPRGGNLSGGQRQMVGMLRAYAKNPSLMLLDEPAAHMDVNAEKHIMTAVVKVLARGTVIMVSHRLALAPKFSRIAVLEENSIVEIGTFNELMAKRGLFYNYYTTQGLTDV